MCRSRRGRWSWARLGVNLGFEEMQFAMPNWLGDSYRIDNVCSDIYKSQLINSEPEWEPDLAAAAAAAALFIVSATILHTSVTRLGNLSR